MDILSEAKRGFMEGVKQIPGKLRSTQSLEFSPVSKYATNPFSSPNISAKKWKNNINRRFRQEAASEVKGVVRRLFNNSPNTKKNKQSPLTQPRNYTRRTPLTVPTLPRYKPSPYLFNTPMTYRNIKKEPEMRGGRTRTLRKNRR